MMRWSPRGYEYSIAPISASLGSIVLLYRNLLLEQKNSQNDSRFAGKKRTNRTNMASRPYASSTTAPAYLSRCWGFSIVAVLDKLVRFVVFLD